MDINTEAGTKVDRQTKMTNIPENRNVCRLFYMKMSEGFSCSGSAHHILDYSSFHILLFVTSQPLL